MYSSLDTVVCLNVLYKKKWIGIDCCTAQEPSLFAVAKLLETGLVNMDRIQILWRPLTGHLLEVCL